MGALKSITLLGILSFSSGEKRLHAHYRTLPPLLPICATSSWNLRLCPHRTARLTVQPVILNHVVLSRINQWVLMGQMEGNTNAAYWFLNVVPAALEILLWMYSHRHCAPFLIKGMTHLSPAFSVGHSLFLALLTTQGSPLSTWKCCYLVLIGKFWLAYLHGLKFEFIRVLITVAGRNLIVTSNLKTWMLVLQECLKSNWNNTNPPCLYSEHRNDLCTGLDCFQWKPAS